MRLTTLCYIEKDGQYLMLHRVSKQHDVNKDKWIGIGGGFQEGESPEECLLREVWEETGLKLTSWRFRGILTFDSEGWEKEYICLYTADKFEGVIGPCDEGVLEWVDKDKVPLLNLWEGDKIFFRLLDEGRPFFSLKLRYQGDRLLQAVLDGQELELFEVADEEGRLTGIVRERTLVHALGDPHWTAHVWMVRRQKEKEGCGWDILLQKRSLIKDSYPGCYDISAAGHVHVGEAHLDTALRELEEELGIHALAGELEWIGLHKGYMEDVFYGRLFKDFELADVYICEKPVDEKKLSLQKEEVDSVQWMDLLLCIHCVERKKMPNCLHLDELELLRHRLLGDL